MRFGLGAAVARARHPGPVGVVTPEWVTRPAGEASPGRVSCRRGEADGGVRGAGPRRHAPGPCDDLRRRTGVDLRRRTGTGLSRRTGVRAPTGGVPWSAALTGAARLAAATAARAAAAGRQEREDSGLGGLLGLSGLGGVGSGAGGFGHGSLLEAECLRPFHARRAGRINGAQWLAPARTPRRPAPPLPATLPPSACTPAARSPQRRSPRPPGGLHRRSPRPATRANAARAGEHRSENGRRPTPPPPPPRFPSPPPAGCPAAATRRRAHP